MRADLELAEQARHRYERERWFVSAVHTYCEAVQRLLDELQSLEPRSRGLRGFRDRLNAYVGSEAFRALAADVTTLVADLAAVRYTLRIRGGSVTVGRWEDESDYGNVIAALFERFTSATPAGERAGRRIPARSTTSSHAWSSAWRCCTRMLFRRSRRSPLATPATWTGRSYASIARCSSTSRISD